MESEYWSALSEAALGGHKALVMQFWERSDVHTESKYWSALSKAASGGHEALVKLFLARDDIC